MTVITFFAILILLVVLQFVIKRMLTKKLQLTKVESGKGRFVNKRHQNVDMLLTFVFLVLFLLFTLTDMIQTPMFDIASPYIIFPVLFVIMELVRTWFQWNESEEPKRAYLTLMNISIIVVLIIFYYLYIIFYF